MMKRNYITFAVGLFLATAIPTIGLAQEADEGVLDAGEPAAPIVVEPAGSRELREAMRRIAVRPKDAEALFDAGNASLMLGDAAAALNFFTKAASIRPNDGRIKAGLGAATVRTENPFEALRLFDEAVKLGISERAIAVDRALAYDLLGNFARAQQDYKLARTAAVSEQLMVQQAISLSLSGAKTEADNMLVPLLQKNNLDAWRARAFMLAARGEFKESTRVAAGFLDSSSARKMESYLRLMPQLTPAQQAAAIHFGHFPQSFEIGRDSAVVTRTASNLPPPTSGSGRLIPAGQPMGPTATVKPVTAERKPSRREIEAAEQAAKQAENQKAFEAARLQEAARFAEFQQQAEAARVAEAARIAESARKADAAKLAETQRLADAQRLAEVEKRAQAEREQAALATAPVLATPNANAAKAISEVKIADATIAQKDAAPMREMPPPEAARPLVDVALPSSNTVKTDILAAPAAAPAAANAAPIVTPTPANGPVLKAAPQSTVFASSAVNLPATQAPKQPEILVPVPAANMPERPAIANAPTDVATVANTGATTPAGSAPSPSPQWVQGVGETAAVDPSPVAVTTNAAPEQAVVEAAPSSVPVEPVKSGFDLGDVVASIEIPESEQQQSVAAVDLKKLKAISDKNAAKAKLAEAEKKAKIDEQADEKSIKAAAKAKSASDNPSRHWVQVATGSDINGLAFDWRRLAKKNPELFKGREGWTSAWGKSNRLVVGPFDDLKSAKKWEAEFRKAGGNGFGWTSEKGMEVQRLRSK